MSSKRPAASVIRLGRSRFQRRIRAEVRERLEDFRNLKSLTADTKAQLLRPVCHYLIRVSAFKRWREAIENFLVIPLIILAMGSLIVAPTLFLVYARPLNEKFMIQDNNDALFGYIIYMGTALFISIAPVFLVFLFSTRALKYIGFPKLFFVWLGINIFIYIIILSRILLLAQMRDLTNKEQVIGISLIGILGYYLTLFFIIFLLSRVTNFMERRKNDIYPNAVVVDSFLNALSMVEKEPKRWIEVDFKNKLITEIEKVSICIEYHLPRSLRSNNPVTDHWVNETSEQMAAGVRSLNKWIFTPREDTRAHFMARIAACLTYSARGDWDSFERVKPEKLSRPEVLRARIKSISTAILSAAVPILVLMLVKRLNIVEGTVLVYLTVGSYIWAALTLLSQLDPLYGTKLTAMKEITQLLPLPGRDKK